MGRAMRKEIVVGSISAVEMFALAVLVGMSMLLAMVNPKLALVVPFVLFGAVAAFRMLARTDGVTLVLLFAPIAMLQGSRAVSVAEAGYALIFASCLSIWFGRSLLDSSRIVSTRGDSQLALFLGLVLPIASFGGLAGGADLRLWIGELFAIAHLALYFPVKRACSESRTNLKLALAALFVAILVGGIVNAMELLSDIAAASRTWELSSLRVSRFDVHFMSIALILLALMVVSRRKLLLVYAPLFIASFGGLMATKSRAFWIVFMVGFVVILFSLDGKRRIQLLVIAFGGTAVIMVLLMVFFRDYVMLVIAGLLFRFETINTGTGDLSLRNRVYESITVLKAIKSNPILGYGPGVTYDYFDLTRMTTDRDSFVHNGYLMLWYKYGLFGLVLVLTFWANKILQGWRAIVKYRSADGLSTGAIVGSLAALVAITISANTSGPFYGIEAVWLIAMLTGILSGTSERIVRERTYTGPAGTPGTVTVERGST